MPYVNIQVTPQGVTPEGKAAVIAGVTRLLVEHFGKDPDLTHIVIQEIPPENWGFSGRQASAPAPASD